MAGLRLNAAIVSVGCLFGATAAVAQESHPVALKTAAVKPTTELSPVELLNRGSRSNAFPSSSPAAGDGERDSSGDSIHRAATNRRDTVVEEPADDESTTRAKSEVVKKAASDAKPANPTRSNSTDARPVTTSSKADSPKTTPANSTDEVKRAAPPEPALSPQLITLRKKVRRVLAMYQTRQLNTRDHTPWEVMHALIAYGVYTDIRRDSPTGDKVNAIGWLCWGGQANGQPLITLERGKVHARIGVGVQGHAGQFMGMLAQSTVKPTYEMRVQGKTFTVADLIEQEKLDCQANTELTFKLIGLSYYLPSDATWTSNDGQTWSIPRLIQEEIKQPIRGAACGGTHRLFGLSSSYLMRKKQGLPIDGEYRRAQLYIANYQRHAFGELQNADGSFSTEWFNRRGDRPDLDRRIQTTGHIFEWLAFSLSDQQLREPRTIKTVNYLAGILQDNPKRDWSIGPLGHALHALVMYDNRVFRSKGATTPKESAAAPEVTSEPSIAPKLGAANTLPELPTLPLAAKAPRHSAETDSEHDGNYAREELRDFEELARRPESTRQPGTAVRRR